MNHLLFPQPIGVDGYQTILGSCSDVEKLRVSNGNLVRQYTVASVATVGPALNFRLTHNSRDSFTGDMGPSWRHNWMTHLEISSLVVTYVDDQGRRYNFDKVGSDWVLDTDNSLFLRKTLTEVSSQWHLKGFGNGDDLTFDASGNLVEVVDSHAQALVLHYTGSLLASVEESSGRELTFTYSSSLLTSVTDPNGNVTRFLYGADSKLVSIIGPEGCMLSYTYASGSSNGLILTRTDARGNVYTYTYGTGGKLLTVSNPASATITYGYDTVNETVSSPHFNTQKSLKRTTLTDAESQDWEYRFDDAGNLWRILDPLDHNRRFYWSDLQDLLYVSEGYGVNQKNDLGPLDSPYNRYTRFLHDDLGNQTGSIDGNGLITQMEYDGDNRMITVTPARATNNIGGNWSEHFGQDGFVMCSALDDSSDLVHLPSYVDSAGILPGEVEDDSNAFVRALPSSAFHRVDARAPWIRMPGSPVRDTYRRTLGMWKTEEENPSFTFRIPISQTGEFNLSFYTHSADQPWYNDNNDSNSEIIYSGSFGRDVEVLVTDFDPITGDPRRQAFRLPNNGAGCWITFGVYAEAESFIRVLVRTRAEISETEFPCINCIAFDPIEQRTTNLYYTGVDLTSVVNPLNQTTVMEYNADGTLKKVTDAKSRDTQFFYEDAAKNLTKITDAASGEVVLTYDDNGNVVSSQDQDGRTSLMEFDAKNRLVKVTDPLSHSTQFSFDPAGNLTAVKDAKGRETFLAYSNLNRLVGVSDALGREVFFEYNATGRLTKVTDALGRESQFSFDAAGRMVETEMADGQKVLYALNAVNRLVSITGPNASQEDWDQINLRGANQMLTNRSMEEGITGPGFTGIHASVWQHGDEFDNAPNEYYARSSSEAHSGTYSLPVATGKYWYYPNVTTYAGGRYVAKAWAKNASGGAATVTASIAADVRDFTAALETQTDASQATVVDTNWTELKPQIVQIPGDTQSLRTQPAVRKLKLLINKTSGGDSDSTAYLDDASLQLVNTCMEYDAENLREVGTADGARFRREFDRVGRLCRLSDPQGRVISLQYDGLDRVVSVSDSLGLTLAYSYDETGQLVSFTDAKNQVMAFAYDALDRLLSITYPDTTTEEFEYSPAGDLQSYTDNNAQERTFDYDVAHRLIGVTYPNLDTLVLAYDELNNLISRTERNGDVETYHYDKLNRVTRCVYSAALGSDSAGWDLTSTFDEVGNRTELAVTGGATPAFYGSARYGTDLYGENTPIWTVPEGGYDEMNRLMEFKDSLDESTTLGYDVEGRRTTVSCPNGTLTEATYDIVGKLLSLRTSLDEEELLKLDYGYNLASDRLAQQTDKAAYTYHLDKSGRLVEETINRFVTQHVEHLAQGELQYCQLDFSSSRVQLLGIADDFQTVNVDRWRPKMDVSYNGSVPYEAHYLGNEMRAHQGLHMVYPSAWTAFQFPYQKDGGGMGPAIRCRVGYQSYAYQELYLRRPLVGDFDLVLEWDGFDLPDGTTQSSTDYYDHPSETHLTMSVRKLNGTEVCYVSRSYQRDPSAYPGPSTNNHYRWYYYNISDGKASADEKAGKLRIKRSGSQLNLYYWDQGAPAWVLCASGKSDYNTDELQLLLRGNSAFGHMNHRLISLSHNDAEPALFPEEGSYTSSLFDAGQVVQWERISWDENLETGTDVKFQVAFSNDVAGPWSYIGPDGTSGTTFTTNTGEDFDATSDFEGRYARFKVTLTGDGTETPSFSNVHLSFSGEGLLDSSVQNYQYDEAGNITMVTTVTDAGSATDERTFNDLNQITEQEVGGDTWTFSYDPNGNMTGKTNGVDTWTYSWTGDENRLVRVQGPGSVDVAYTYDSMGRMLTRDDGTDLTTFTWDNWDCVKEVTGESETVYFAPEGQILSFIRDGNVYQAHSDALGSIRMITDDEGEVVARYEYGAFGEAIYVTEEPMLAGFPYRFVGSAGVRFDATTGLHYMRARWYDCQIQRFVSRDPIGLGGGSNLYAYASNNPLVETDPDGLLPKPFAERVDLALQKIRDLGYSAEADAVAAKISKIPRNEWWKKFDSWGFTNPLNDKEITICDVNDSVWLTATLFHEGQHLLQSKAELALLGITGHWIKNPVAKDDLEFGAYSKEVEFLKKWGSDPNIDGNTWIEINDMTAKLENHLKEMYRDARDYKKKYDGWF